MSISFKSPFTKKFLSPVGEPTLRLHPTITVNPKKIWQGAKDLFHSAKRVVNETKQEGPIRGLMSFGRELSQGAPRPESTPMATPTKMPSPTPTRVPTLKSERAVPTAKPTPIPPNIKELDYEKRPYHKEIVNAWGDKSDIAHDILRYVNEEGIVKGENVDYMAGDIPNRINPKTGKWDSSAPIATFINPFTKKRENSIDRGLFRINNKTFYDYQKRFPDILKNNGITKWDDMLDPAKNSIMAKIIFDIQKQGWYGAKPSTGARIK